MLNFNYYDQPGTASSVGVFIPRDNIAGLVENEELNIYQPDIIRDCKFLSGFLTTLESSTLVSTALGFSIEKSNLIGGAGGVFNQIFSINIAESVDYSTRAFYSIPTPIIGANVGLGALKIVDVFPNAASVSNQGAISTAGILIPHSELTFYGASSQNPNNDSRQWFTAIIRYLFDKITIRENTTIEPFSALIGKTLGNFNRFSLPTNALDSSNPTTGLNSAKVIDVYSRIIEFNIQYLLSEKNQSFEIRNYIKSPINISIEFLNIPTNSTNPIESINIKFSEAINVASFNFTDIFLIRDNGNNLINSNVTIEYISDTTYRINGLGTLTSIAGTYQLTINTNGIQNLAGNYGSTIAQTTFLINSIITLVDNLPPITTTLSSGGAVRTNSWLRSSFTTGGGSGYTLNSVTLQFRQNTPNANLFVRLYEDNAGVLGDLITSFINPASISTTLPNGADTVFTLTTPQTLAANTSFWLLAGIDAPVGTGGEYSWRGTNSFDQTGEPGWSIGNSSLFSDNQGLSWITSTIANAFQFKATGSVN
jgi:hypothetical protein